MGRTDAVQVQLEVAREVQRINPRIQITWEPGWETRGNGTRANYEGGIVHHTATPSSLARPFPTQAMLRNGRTGLPGPLCNWAGPACTVEAPRLHVMAANPGNHAGASGGRSMGPLPVTSLFNPRVLGLEVDYAGLVPMLPGQMIAALVWSRAVANVVGGGDINRIRAHYETSVTGKWDIGNGNGRSYDMNGFRRDAANIAAIVAQEEDDFMALFRDLNEFMQAVNRASMCLTPSDRKTPWAYDMIAGTDAKTGVIANDVASLRKELSGLRSAVDTLAKALAQQSNDLTAEEITEAVRRGMVETVNVRVSVDGDAA